MSAFATTNKCGLHQCLNCGWIILNEEITRTEELKLLRKYLKGKTITSEQIRIYITERIKELKGKI